MRVPKRSLIRDQSGQAMVEYSVITLWLTLSTAFGVITFVGPTLLNALNAYMNSVYYVLNLPLP